MRHGGAGIGGRPVSVTSERESRPAVIAVLDAYDAIEAEVDRLRELLAEIGLIAANVAPERAVERIDELTDQRFPPHA